MRYTGTSARGIRLPIINRGDALADIVAECIGRAAEVEGFGLSSNDVVGVTEAVVGKAQGNYATLAQVAGDVEQKFPGGRVGVVFPIMSRNRFLYILKGIVMGCDEVFVLMSYPSDEVGNPIMDLRLVDEINDRLAGADMPVPAGEFRGIVGDFTHPFTDVDYISLYESCGAKVYFSNDPRDILKLSPHVLAADIHTRFLTRDRLLRAGAETVYTLSDILSQPVNGSGFNPKYGLLGSNIAGEDSLKLFPRNCDAFVLDLQEKINARTGARPEVMVYGDGAYKDPEHMIWELADPVVSPGYTSRLDGRPSELKMKMIADTRLAGLSAEEQTRLMKEIIKEKSGENAFVNEGTTPRKYADLLGSLCDLMGGSGDKGTPVVLVQGYFDSYADEGDGHGRDSRGNIRNRASGRESNAQHPAGKGKAASPHRG